MRAAISYLESLCGVDLALVRPLSPTYGFMIEIYNDYNMHEEGFFYPHEEREVIDTLERELGFDGWDAKVLWYWDLRIMELYYCADDPRNAGEGLPEEDDDDDDGMQAQVQVHAAQTATSSDRAQTETEDDGTTTETS